MGPANMLRETRHNMQTSAGPSPVKTQGQRHIVRGFAQLGVALCTLALAAPALAQSKQTIYRWWRCRAEIVLESHAFQDASELAGKLQATGMMIARMGFSPTECLIVEDNENGIRAARASGAHVMEVDEVTDVTYANITARIAECEKAQAA